MNAVIFDCDGTLVDSEVLTNEYGDMVAQGISDPVKVTRSAA